MQDISLKKIGLARTAYKNKSDCPRQGTNKCAGGKIEISPDWAAAMHRMYAGQEIIIITWLDRADRNTLQCRPRGDENLPVHGIFCTRSPNRPNPLGLHPCTITEIHKRALSVDHLDVLDGTPVVDIKPDIRPMRDSQSLGLEFPLKHAEELISWGTKLWERGLLSGVNGNLSIRREDRMLITRSGANKGALSLDDLAVVSVEDGSILAGKKPSSEAGMHLGIYRNQPRAGAIAHTHPPHILALNISQRQRELSGLPLFETGTFAPMLGYIPPLEPGSKDLADKCAETSRGNKCLVLEKHGLACWGENIQEAAGLSEEVESLARIALLSAD